MKEHWYLVASLPHLRLGEKPSVSAEQFRMLCSDWLSADEQQVVEAILDGALPETDLSSAWVAGETQLRNAVARVRARQYNVDAAAHSHTGFEVVIEQGVADAFARDNPLEREMEMDRLRWKLADERSVGDSFGFSAVLAFAVKIIIAERWAALDETVGKASVEELVSSTIVHT